MAHRLSTIDNAFLQLEDAENRMQLAGMLLFEDKAPDFEEFQRVVSERLLELPHFTQRLSTTLLGLTRPRWVDDPAFELGYHVTRTALPSPGGEAEVSAHIEGMTAAPLDLRRPLRELSLVEGVEGGFGVSLKVHHCMVDGLSIIQIFQALLMPDSHVPDLPSSGRSKAAAHTPGPIAGLVDAVGLVRQAPASAFNSGAAGPTRQVSFVTVPLDDIHRIRRTYGTTVNNIVLAIVSGGLRRYLLEQHAMVDRLYAFVPVNARSADARGSLGNQIAMTYPALPVGESDAEARVTKVIAAVQKTVRSGQATMTGSLMSVLGLAPTPIAATLIRAMQFHAGMFNVTVTNVPGPRGPMSFMGRQLRLIVGSTPLTRQHALTIAVLTYNGELTFMVTSDPRRVPDGKTITDHLHEEFVELRNVASSPPRSRRAPTIET